MIFFSFKQKIWLTGNCSYFIFIANISSVLKASVVSLPRIKTGSNAHMQSFFCLRAFKDTCRVLFHQQDSQPSQVGATLIPSLCWKGKARHFKDILRLFICAWLPEWEARLRRVRFGVFWYFNLSLLRSLLLVVLPCWVLAIGLGYLFIQSEYVNLCSPLSLNLCSLAPSFCWDFEWKKHWMSLSA